jgi:hypothetical protein
MSAMVYMMNLVEQRGERIYNMFPMRRSSVPCHFTMHTRTLESIFGLNTRATLTEQKKYNDWNSIFDLAKRVFRAKNKFDYTIQTDGISCCIQLIRGSSTSSSSSSTSTYYLSRSSQPNQLKYITELNQSEKEYIKDQNLKLIAIDPGKDDLIYCVDGINRKKQIHNLFGFYGFRLFNRWKSNPKELLNELME